MSNIHDCYSVSSTSVPTRSSVEHSSNNCTQESPRIGQRQFLQDYFPFIVTTSCFPNFKSWPLSTTNVLKSTNKEQTALIDDIRTWHICMPDKCLPFYCSIETAQLNRCWSGIYLHKWQVNRGRPWRREEQHQFVCPQGAVFVQPGLNNVLTVQVQDKSARKARVSVGRQMCMIYNNQHLCFSVSVIP